MISLLLTGAALAHSWYPSQCCSGTDCKPVDCDQLVEVSQPPGWVYLPTGTWFSTGWVHPSQDKHCHVCIQGESGLCAFIQNGV